MRNGLHQGKALGLEKQYFRIVIMGMELLRVWLTLEYCKALLSVAL